MDTHMSVSLQHHHVRIRRIETVFEDDVVTNGTLSTTTLGGWNNSTIQPPPPPPASSSSGTQVSAPISEQQQLTVFGYIIIVILSFIVVACIYYMIRFIYRYYIDQRQHHHETITRRIGSPSSSTNTTDTEMSAFDKERIQRRYETIEHWTISKRVQDHTICCTTIQMKCNCSTPLNTTTTAAAAIESEDGTVAKDTNNNCCNNNGITTTILPPSSVSTNTTPTDNNIETISSLSLPSLQVVPEHERRECPICMSEFMVGQVISWSTNPNCIHVYHHECMKEWLLRNTECCLCKEIYLPIDAKKKQQKLLQQRQNNSTKDGSKQYQAPNIIAELSQQYKTALATSYYCVQHGLIRIPETFCCTQDELTQIEKLLMEGTISPTDLKLLRGNNNTSADNNPMTDPTINRNEYNNGTVLNQEVEIIDSVSRDNDDATLPMNLTASFDSDNYIEGVETTVIHTDMQQQIDRDSSSNITTTRSTSFVEVHSQCHDDIDFDEENNLHDKSFSLDIDQEELQTNQQEHVAVLSEPQHEQQQSQETMLVSMSDYIQQRQFTLPDNRCCVKESSIQYNNGTGIEVEATISRRVHDTGDETNYTSSSNADLYSTTSS